MSSYANFIRDFPNRCLDILKNYEKDAYIRDREVTLMLAIATAGFVVPFERLRPSSENLDHPSGDREKFKDAADKFKEILNFPFIRSKLWNGDVRSWKFDKELDDVQREPDFWPELNSPKSLSTEKRVSSVLKHLRNALAHGNIYTKGNPIQLIIFLSRCCEYVDNQCKHSMLCSNCGSKISCEYVDKKCEPTNKYDMLGVSPQDFSKFLMNWLNFLASLPIPTTISQESIMELLEYTA